LKFYIPCIFLYLIYQPIDALIKYNLWQILNSCLFWHLGDILSVSFKQKVKPQNTNLHMHCSHCNESLTNYVVLWVLWITFTLLFLVKI
jgi:hypothetical protein